MSQLNNKPLTSKYHSGTITNSDYTLPDHSEFNGDVVINGRLIIDGDIYQKDDKCDMNKEDTHDTEIEVVDNGFMVSIGDRTYVFSDLDELDKWMLENFKTPKKAKKTVREASGMTQAQKDMLQGFEKLTRNPSTQPYDNLNPQQWGNPFGDSVLDQQIRGGIADSGTGTSLPYMYGGGTSGDTSNTSINTKEI